LPESKPLPVASSAAGSSFLAARQGRVAAFIPGVRMPKAHAWSNLKSTQALRRKPGFNITTTVGGQTVEYHPFLLPDAGSVG
jgi:hypothetical protein